MTKEEIRIRQKELRKKLSGREREQSDLQIRERLFGTEAYQKCKYLFSYVSFGTETDTREIILKALKDGKRVYVPRVEGKTMEFYEIHGLEGLIPSGFGVPEPPEDDKIQSFPKSAVNFPPYDNLMLLPGLAFDLSGSRIGYGAGYYDRYLSEHLEINFYKTALAYDFQIMDSIMEEKFDKKADAILTPTRFILCR